MSVPNFSSLACLEWAEKVVLGGVVGFAESFYCQTQPCVEVRLGF